MQFVANCVDRNAVVGVEKYGAEQVGRLARPVLEWLFNEVGHRHDQTPQVPNTHHDVSDVDLFDPTPFTFDNHGIAEPNRLGERDLNSGSEVGEGVASCKPSD